MNVDYIRNKYGAIISEAIGGQWFSIFINAGVVNIDLDCTLKTEHVKKLAIVLETIENEGGLQLENIKE